MDLAYGPQFTDPCLRMWDLFWMLCVHMCSRIARVESLTALTVVAEEESHTIRFQSLKRKLSEQSGRIIKVCDCGCVEV